MVLSTLLQNRMVLSLLHLSCLILALFLSPENLMVLSSFTSEPTWTSIYLLASEPHAWFSLFTSEPHGLLLSPPKPCGPPPSMAAAPRFKSQHPSSFAAPFPTPPTISYTASIPLFFQLYWAAIVSLGRCGPMAWSQSSPCSHAGAVTRGSCFPVPSGVEVTPISLAQSRATAI